MCDYTLYSADNLRLHFRTYNRAEKNKCNQCDLASSKEGNLKVHLKRHWRKVKRIQPKVFTLHVNLKVLYHFCSFYHSFHKRRWGPRLANLKKKPGKTKNLLCQIACSRLYEVTPITVDWFFATVASFVYHCYLPFLFAAVGGGTVLGLSLIHI